MTDNNKEKTAGYESIRRFFNKKNIMNILGVLIMLYTVWLLIRICSACFGNISVPNEYREAANIQLTKAFMDGVNPYRLSAYDGELPGMIFVYGPLYSLFTAFLGKFIHVDIIFLHYAVTLCSVLISALLGAVITFRKTHYLAAPAAVFLFIINCSWRYGYINAVPDAFALMLYMFIIFIISIEAGRDGALVRKIILTDIICSILCISLFFVKQYFALIAAAVFIYKFINDKKDGLRFLFINLLISVLVFITISLTCPLYWTYSIYLAHGPFGITQEQYNKAYGGYMEKPAPSDENEENKTEAEKEDGHEEDGSFTAQSINTDPKAGFGYEILQLKSLAGMFLFLFISVLWGIIVQIKNGFKDRTDLMIFLLILMAVSSVALIYLGRNDGAWLSYYLQLLMPEVIIYSFIFADGLIFGEKGVVLAFAAALFLLMTFFTAYRTNGRLKIYDKTPEQMEAWERAYELAASYADKGEVSYVPVLGFQTFNNGQYLYNNGHSMVINGWFRGEYHAVPWEQKVFPKAGMVLDRHYDYQESIKDKAKNKEYALVTIIDGTDTDFERLNVDDLKNDGYKKIDSILLNTGRMSHEVEFWVPE